MSLYKLTSLYNSISNPNSYFTASKKTIRMRKTDENGGFSTKKC